MMFSNSRRRQARLDRGPPSARRTRSSFDPVLAVLGKLARLGRRSSGQALVFVIVALPVALGMAGIAVDEGQLYVNRTNAQRTADAAAVAGAQSVLTSSDQGTTYAQNYAAYNHDPSAQVTVLTTARAHDTVRVTSQRTVSLTFMGMLGLSSKVISATATAQAGPAGTAYGVLPWAVNDDSFGGYNTTVGLQPANGNSGSGSYNYVSITPPGSQTYAQAIVSGVSAEILLNTNYPTNTFDGSSLSSTTANALQARINAAASETYATALTGSPRIIFVPVINGNVPNAPNPVRFTGFRAFFIESVNQGNSTVWGRFVQVDLPKGTIGGGSVPDKGVHVVKIIN